MKYSTFSRTRNDQIKEPMFLGQSVNVARYDRQKYSKFEEITAQQLAFFWHPQEIDLYPDKGQFEKLPVHQKHIFLSNLKYQTLLDSIQGRSPNVAFLPLVSIPELETWIETWSFFETIHSRSYTHIIRNIVNDTDSVFNDIVENEHIIARTKEISHYYDDLIEYSSLWLNFGEGRHQINDRIVEVNLHDLKKKLYMALMCVNVLEGIRFYVSFACSFAFTKHLGIMKGNTQIIKFIARDEQVHLNSTQHILKYMRENPDEGFQEIAQECYQDSIDLFRRAVAQEKDWAAYLFKDGHMPGLNLNILCEYVEFIANQRMKAVNLPPLFVERKNPIKWINDFLTSDSVQVAPQEIGISSYTVGNIDAYINPDELKKIEL